MKWPAWPWLATLLLASGQAAPGLAGETYSFALIGDVPYSARERRELPRMLAAMATAKVAFVVHDGDIKSGGEPCTDSLLQQRRDLLDASAVPLIYTPGDNEWSDCDRAAAGHYQPEERLAALRRLFFARDRSLGRTTLPLERPTGAGAEYRENARWRLGPVRFVTLNIAGGDNNYGPGPEPSPEFQRRNAANRAWLAESFALARQEGARGVVVIIQADPGLKHDEEGLPHRGFRDFLTQLRAETLAFAGPVVLVHGDTHWNRIDHPWRDPASRAPLLRFTRVETFGYPVMGWVKGIIDTDRPELFRFENHPWPPTPSAPFSPQTGSLRAKPLRTARVMQ